MPADYKIAHNSFKAPDYKSSSLYQVEHTMKMASVVCLQIPIYHTLPTSFPALISIQQTVYEALAS